MVEADRFPAGSGVSHLTHLTDLTFLTIRRLLTQRCPARQPSARHIYRGPQKKTGSACRPASRSRNGDSFAQSGVEGRPACRKLNTLTTAKESEICCMN